MRSRPGKPITVPYYRPNSIPLLAVSPKGNIHYYPSISSFVRDVDSLGSSKRTTASRRISNQSGGLINSWFIRAI